MSHEERLKRLQLFNMKRSWRRASMMVYKNKDNVQGKCRTCLSNSKQQNWEALSETNTRSSQTDVSFTVAALGSVCMPVFKQVTEFLEPVPQSCERRQYQWVWTKSLSP